MGRHRSSEMTNKENCICTEICNHLKRISREQSITTKESHDNIGKAIIQKEDEQLIPKFDPATNDITIQQWIKLLQNFVGLISL